MASPAATLTVTSNADSGAGTLRQAIVDADSGDTINFDAALNGSVITLTSELAFDKSLTIEGPGPDLLMIDGNHNSRIFTLNSYPDSISDNTVMISGLLPTRGSATSGGAIAALTGWNTKAIALTVSNCVIRANQSTAGGGGGVHKARKSSLTMIDCLVVSNDCAVATSSFGGGGVYATHDGDVLFERVAIISNQSNRSGGGLTIESNGIIRDCLFFDNKSTYGVAYNPQIGGGGIQINSRTLSLVNSTVSGNNSANPGGGIQLESNGNLRLFNSTVANNVAGQRGGGINNHTNNSGSVILNSSIVDGNTGNGYGDLYGTFVGVTNCLIQVSSGADVSIMSSDRNIIGQSAQLVSLADNGGPTRTHALQKTSPAIDKGSNPLNLATDQRGTGYPRLSGTAVDIGAYEYPIPPGGTVFLVR